jgi:glutaredoxin
MGHSSFGGGSLYSASSVSQQHVIYMQLYAWGPMFVLTFSVAILDEHTLLARLEIDASLLAALGTADADLVHDSTDPPISQNVHRIWAGSGGIVGSTDPLCLLIDDIIEMVVGRVCRVRAFQNLTTPHRRSFASLIQPPDVKLYQYQICPFCNITKSVLSHTEIDYTSVEVNPLTKAELKPWSGGYKKVPIALIDGCQINGSEEILNSILNTPYAQHTLKERWVNINNENDKGSEIMTIETFRQSENAQKWTRFAIDDLAALLYPNICSTLCDSYNAFGYVKNVDTFTSLQKVTIQSLGAVAMYIAAGKIKCELPCRVWRVRVWYLMYPFSICNSHCVTPITFLQQSEILQMKRSHLRKHSTSTNRKGYKMAN